MLGFTKTNEKTLCFRVPQGSSLPQSCAKEKSSGVEIAGNEEALLPVVGHSAITPRIQLRYGYVILIHLERESLTFRRQYARLCTMYKITNEIIHVNTR